MSPEAQCSLLDRSRRTAAEWAEPSEPYALGELTVNYAERRVSLAGRPVQLTDIEYRLLCELAGNAGRVLTHDQLLQRVWGLTNSGGSGPVRTVVKNLRRKLADDADSPTHTFNEPRVGYWMPQGRDAGTGGAVSVEPLLARGSLRPTGWGTGSDYRSRTNLNVRVHDFGQCGGPTWT